MAYTLVRQLEEQWTYDADSLSYLAALASWHKTEPDLCPFNDFAALTKAAADRGDPAATDRILAALVRRAAVDCGNDALAARTVLQLLLPGATALSAALSSYGEHDDVLSAVLATLLERIRTYPWQRRPQRVAANLLLDTRMTLRTQRAREVSEAAAGAIGADNAHSDTAGDRGAGLTPELQRELAQGRAVALVAAVPQPGDEDPRVELLELFMWAMNTGAVSATEITLITESRLEEVDLGVIAARTGTSRGTLMRQRQRAERRLAASALQWRQQLDLAS